MQRCIKILLFHIYIKLHWHPLVFHTWKVVGRVVDGRCQARTVPDNVQQPSTYEKPESVSAVLGFCRWAVCHPKHVELHINME